MSSKSQRNAHRKEVRRIHGVRYSKADMLEVANAEKALLVAHGVEVTCRGEKPGEPLVVVYRPAGIDRQEKAIACYYPMTGCLVLGRKSISNVTFEQARERVIAAGGQKESSSPRKSVPPASASDDIAL